MRGAGICIKSEAVESDEYFFTVLRYIHENSVKAGIVKSLPDYWWSSYIEYIREAVIVDIDFVLDIFSADRKRAIELYQEYNIQKNNDMCLEVEEKSRVSDSQMKEYFKNPDISDPRELRQVGKIKGDEILRSSNY